MACGCRDESGKLLEICLGICKKPIEVMTQFQLIIENQQRAILLEIASLKQYISQKMSEEYRQGFKDGFEKGRD